MRALNKVMLIGRLGKDPEVRYLEGGTPVANFTIATSEKYKNKSGEWVEQTEWHNIVAWRGLAELTEKYLKKGKQVFIEGKIRTRSWEDKDKNKRYTTEVVADNMMLLGSPEKHDESSNIPEAVSAVKDELTETAHVPAKPADDLPF